MGLPSLSVFVEEKIFTLWVRMPASVATIRTRVVSTRTFWGTIRYSSRRRRTTPPRTWSVSSPPQPATAKASMARDASARIRDRIIPYASAPHARPPPYPRRPGRARRGGDDARRLRHAERQRLAVRRAAGQARGRPLRRALRRLSHLQQGRHPG